MELVEHGAMPLAQHAHDHGHGHGMSTERKNYILKMGWWVYIASEVMLFSSFIAVFLLAKRLYPEDAPHVSLALISFNTFLLLTSSWTVVRALASAQEGDTKGVQRSLFLSLALGGIFVLLQGYEYNQLAHEGFTLSSSMWASAFYVLTGFHGAHVIIGVFWLLWAFIKSLDGHFTQENYIGLEVLGLYWHFVDVVWVFLFPLIYLL